MINGKDGTFHLLHRKQGEVELFSDFDKRGSPNIRQLRECNIGYQYTHSRKPNNFVVS